MAELTESSSRVMRISEVPLETMMIIVVTTSSTSKWQTDKQIFLNKDNVFRHRNT